MADNLSHPGGDGGEKEVHPAHHHMNAWGMPQQAQQQQPPPPYQQYHHPASGRQSPPPYPTAAAYGGGGGHGIVARNSPPPHQMQQSLHPQGGGYSQQQQGVYPSYHHAHAQQAPAQQQSYSSYGGYHQPSTSSQNPYYGGHSQQQQQLAPSHHHQQQQQYQQHHNAYYAAQYQQHPGQPYSRSAGPSPQPMEADFEKSENQQQQMYQQQLYQQQYQQHYMAAAAAAHQQGHPHYGHYDMPYEYQQQQQYQQQYQHYPRGGGGDITKTPHQPSHRVTFDQVSSAPDTGSESHYSTNDRRFSFASSMNAIDGAQTPSPPAIPPPPPPQLTQKPAPLALAPKATEAEIGGGDYNTLGEGPLRVSNVLNNNSSNQHQDQEGSSNVAKSSSANGKTVVTGQQQHHGSSEKKQTLDTASVLLAFSSAKKARPESATSTLDDNHTLHSSSHDEGHRSFTTTPTDMSVATINTVAELNEPYLIPTHYPKRLALPEDKEKLNALHCFMRSDLLELVIIQHGDNNSLDPVKNPTSTHAQQIGRVGLRCVHCAMSPDGGRDGPPMSIFYPRTVSEIYRLVTSWKRCHLSKCRHLPPSVRQEWDQLKDCKARGKTVYWTESAHQIGLVDLPTKIGGIRFHPSVGMHYGATQQRLQQTSMATSTAKPPPSLPPAPLTKGNSEDTADATIGTLSDSELLALPPPSEKETAEEGAKEEQATLSRTQFGAASGDNEDDDDDHHDDDGDDDDDIPHCDSLPHVPSV